MLLLEDLAMALSSAEFTLPGILAQPGKCLWRALSEHFNLMPGCASPAQHRAQYHCAHLGAVTDLFNVLWWLGECKLPLPLEIQHRKCI